MRPVALLLLVACNSSSSGAPAAKGQQTKTTAPDGDMPAGVWMGLGEKMNLTSPLLTDLKLQSIVAWPDGHFIYDVPWSGLADFDYAAYARDVVKNASLGGRPGTWQASGDGWKVAYNDGGSAELTRDGDRLSLKKTKLTRLKDVTGATLDGTYTWTSQPEDPSLAGPGCRPIVVFTRDGTFDDRGGFIISCLATDANAPGTGTYELRDFSLIMHYADGRTRRHLLLPPMNLDLHDNSANAVIMGQLWHRRTAPIAAERPTFAPVTAPTPTAPPPVAAAPGMTTFDVVSFATPTGQMTQTKSSISFVSGADDTFCMTAVFASVPTTGDAARDFAADWKDIMLNGRTAESNPTVQQGQTPTGLAFTAGGSMTTEASNGVRVYRALFVFNVNGRRVSVMAVASTEANLATCHFENVLTSIRAN